MDAAMIMRYLLIFAAVAFVASAVDIYIDLTGYLIAALAVAWYRRREGKA